MKPSERIDEIALERTKRHNGQSEYGYTVSVQLRDVIAYLDEQHELAEPDPSEVPIPGEYRETVFASGRVAGSAVSVVIGQTENGEEVTGG